MKREGFARAALLLVDISKVKLLKGNSTSKTNRKRAHGWLTDGSGVCVCVRFRVPGESVLPENEIFHREGGSRDSGRGSERHLCVYIGLIPFPLPSHVIAFFVLSIKTLCGCLDPTTYIF